MKLSSTAETLDPLNVTFTFFVSPVLSLGNRFDILDMYVRLTWMSFTSSAAPPSGISASTAVASLRRAASVASSDRRMGGRTARSSSFPKSI